ncbi:trypsin-like peptidase domain-containing protein [Draconibacterium sp. IB214405]|uniref:S1C family serine protease n=1 Tax=Draconibacterium sp. IB214405 TaxID=3097352 RepID=UPI002A16530E|nr:trypsin-like peptidase domain-containing protein [Draconibacterium sp. IB214405]MDX8339961.1 trypsin-like peptidase domain-containing protein [Draconibacterium sp. IB214405]
MLKLYSLAFILLFALSTKAQTFADLVEKVNKSVVTIQVLQKENAGEGNPNGFTAGEGMGSGVLIGEKKIYILTAAHVVANASQIQVVFYDGSQTGATIRRIDQTSDVALLQLNLVASDFPSAPIGNSNEMRIGDDIFIIGNPLGLAHSVSRGIISGKHVEKSPANNEKLQEFFQTDASINKGNSGGPMFNMNGEVVGIVSSILSFSGGFEGLGFAATSSIAEEILKQHGRIWFGTRILAMTADFCKIFNIPQEGALMVQAVVENSPAYFMGLKGGYLKMKIGDTEILAGGDIILQFDDIQMNSSENILKFYDYLNTMKSGQTYKVKILRGGEIKNLSWRMQ